MNPHKILTAKHIAESIDSLHVANYLLTSHYCGEFETAKEIRAIRETLWKIRDKLIEAKEESA